MFIVDLGTDFVEELIAGLCGEENRAEWLVLLNDVCQMNLDEY